MPAKRLTLEEINKRCSSYDVECLHYEGTRNPSTMKCKKCNHKWYKKGSFRNPWCPMCHSDKLGSGGHSKTSNGDFYKKFENRSITPIGIYQTSHTKMLFECKVCKHQWESMPYSMLNNRGCIKCANEKKANTMALKYYDRPTIFYVIYFPKQKAFKPGITTRTVTERYSNTSEPFIILFQQKFKTGKPAWQKEQVILNQTKHLKYKKHNFLGGGYHELRSFINNIRI